MARREARIPETGIFSETAFSMKSKSICHLGMAHQPQFGLETNGLPTSRRACPASMPPNT